MATEPRLVGVWPCSLLQSVVFIRYKRFFLIHSVKICAIRGKKIHLRPGTPTERWCYSDNLVQVFKKGAPGSSLAGGICGLRDLDPLLL